MFSENFGELYIDKWGLFLVLAVKLVHEDLADLVVLVLVVNGSKDLFAIFGGQLENYQVNVFVEKIFRVFGMRYETAVDDPVHLKLTELFKFLLNAVLIHKGTQLKFIIIYVCHFDRSFQNQGVNPASDGAF